MNSRCRHVRTNSSRCAAAAMNESHWCYFHARLHDQYAQRAAREAERRKREAERRRRDAQRQPRLSDGTFAPAEETIDQGYPVGNSAELAVLDSENAQTAALRLPDVEDCASIQLALIEVIHALAGDQIDPRRASLLLYALQVASTNAKNVHLVGSVSSIDYTEEGIPFAS